jgi:hypothetical protein
VGFNGGNTIRRAVMEFDVSAIPAGSSITSVQLRLQLVKAASASGSSMSLHPLLGDWGEGTANDLTGGGGGGAASLAGDATWLDQFKGSDPWATPGGDFVETPSATLAVSSALNAKTFASTAQLVADVQGWVDSPDTNFGWILRGDESIPRTARKFASRTFGNVNHRPTLTIEFTPPTRIPGDVNDDGDVDRDDVVMMAANWGRTAATEDHGDFTDDSRVGALDLAMLQENFGLPKRPGVAGHPIVPEPAPWTWVVPVIMAAAWRYGPRRLAA